MTTRRRHLIGLLALVAACGGPRDADLVTIETGILIHDDPMISPDGRRLVFTSSAADSDAVYVVDIDGGHARRLSPFLQNVDEPIWSPDGRSILYRGLDPTGVPALYLVPADGGTPTRLSTPEVDSDTPAFSPDGSIILFTGLKAGRTTLWTVPVAGGAATELLPDAGVAMHDGSWSPDGGRIAMAIYPHDSAFIAVLDRATGRLERVTHEGSEVLPKWSPDGTELVYMTFRTGQPDIWAVSATGGEPRQLTRDVRADYSPAWSPDGRFVAYNSRRGGQPDIWVMPAAGGDAVRVTKDRAREGRAHWLPDGSGLYFLSDERENQLYSVPASGGDLTLLTPGTDIYLDPQVSPDGTMIATSIPRGGVRGLYLLPVGGGEERALVTDVNVPEAAWSPDGTMLAFAARRGGAQQGIWVMQLDTGEEWQVSPSGAQAAVPAWSPDGSRLAFLSRAFGGNRLVTAGVHGGDLTLVSDLNAPLFPRWSPEGEWLLVSAARPDGNGRGLFRVPAAGGEAELLTAGQRLGEGGADWSPDGSRIGYSAVTADGSEHLFTMAADGSERTRVTETPEPEYFFLWSGDGSEIFFVTDARPTGLSALTIATGARRQVFSGELRLSGAGWPADRSFFVFEAYREGNQIVRVAVDDALRALQR